MKLVYEVRTYMLDGEAWLLAKEVVVCIVVGRAATKVGNRGGGQSHTTNLAPRSVILINMSFRSPTLSYSDHVRLI